MHFGASMPMRTFLPSISSTVTTILSPMRMLSRCLRLSANMFPSLGTIAFHKQSNSSLMPIVHFLQQEIPSAVPLQESQIGVRPTCETNFAIRKPRGRYSVRMHPLVHWLTCLEHEEFAQAHKNMTGSASAFDPNAASETFVSNGYSRLLDE